MIDADMVGALRIIKDKGALIFLCIAYESGDGISRDIVKAAKCIQKEAELGRVGAQVILGIKYQKGEGVPIDFAKAAQWFQEAVNQGDAEAQNRLGTMYVNGQGVIKDRQKGCELLQASAEQGHKEAIVIHNQVCAGASSSQSGYGSSPNIDNGQVFEGSIPSSLKSSSPSFDCAKASNPVEHTICSHAYLAELDSKMVAEYRRALNGLDTTDRSALRMGQRQWLRERNKCSQAVDIESCLTERYNARLIQLR
ncbi:lysozyme inhibitor LprI family protein [Deltaproteobacteria bacterium OttesenSCG-928-M10]|nr:lysozyme inhibitor LprI family protein [Deltaproteobacteria bacterium OttesenSCG-928-M10]